MIKFVRTVEFSDVPEIVDDYFARFPEGDQPAACVEVIDCDGKTYYRLSNVNGVLAIYDDADQFVTEDERQDVWHRSVGGNF